MGRAAALVALFYLGALLLLQTGPVRRALRAHAVAALAHRFPEARLEGPVRVDAALRLVMGPVVFDAPGEGSPLVVLDRLAVHPRWGRLLGGHLEPGSVALQGVHVQAGRRGERLGDLARMLHRDRRGGGPGGPSSSTQVIDFSGWDLRVGAPRAGGAPVAFGPLAGRLRLERSENGARATLALEGPGRSEGRIEAAWGQGPGALKIRLGGMGAEVVPEGLRADLPFAIRSGGIDLAFEAPRLEAFGRGEGRLSLVARDLVLSGDHLASGSMGPLPLHFTGRLRWDAGARTLALDEGTAALDPAGRTAVRVGLSVAARPEPAFELSFRAVAVDWATLAAFLPPALAPPPAAPALTGTLRGALNLSGPLRQPTEWRLEGDVDPSRLVPAPGGPGQDLARPFAYEAQLTRGGTRRMIIGPENPAFVPLGELPDHLVRAVLLSEDAGFYGHRGFDLSEVQDALSTGGRLRGASTLSQQLAKNLFLSRDRTLARKVREALATLALEAALGKRRILEIYLNLAEWGDGVYGIGEAARHWFGRDARTLSPKEAVMLATVIPNPVRYEMYLRRGALTPAWEARVADLLEKLHAAGVLDDAAFRAAEAEQLTFAGGPSTAKGPEDPPPDGRGEAERP